MSDPANKPPPAHRPISLKETVLSGAAVILGVVLFTVGVIIGLLVYVAAPIFNRGPVTAFMWFSLPFLLVGGLILIGLVLQPLR